jgi:hypothetical protein
MTNTANLDATAPTALSAAKVLPLAAIGGAAAAVANVAIALIAPSIIGTALALPMNPSEPQNLQALPVFMVAIASFIPAFAAAGLLLLLSRFVKNALQVFTIVAVVFLLLSFGGPMTLPVAIGMKLTLSLMHLVAGLLIVLALRRPAASA